MRPLRACVQCRSGKRRCDRIEPKLACKQCIQRNLPCSALTTHLEAQAPSRASSSLSSLPLVTRHDEEVFQLVDLYFKFMHDKPHTLFHEPSFKSSVINGTASRLVLLSMMGLSARFADDPEIRCHGPLYAAEAKKALKDDLEHICTENIQACILIGNICLGDSDPAAESLYFVLANRMAQILNIGVAVHSDDGVTRETKLRIWWTCFIIDTWASGGSNLSRQFKLQAKRPRVPMDEFTFFGMKPGDPDIPDSEWKPGLWGYAVKLVEIYTQIQDLNRYLAEASEWDEDLIEDTVRGLSVELVAFNENLRPEMRYSAENLALHVSRGLGGTFIAFHLGYHHYCTLLFYQYLDQHRPPTTNGKAYATCCKLHAMKFCDILKASREQEEAGALYNIVGHITVVSSSVLLHTYLFGDVDELPDTRRRLESNLESLVQLRNYWSSIELMINRLVVFQNSCMRSLTKNTHRFDRWMIKFLTEHALALDEKVEDLPNPWPQTTASETTASETNALTVESTHIERSRVTQSILADMQNFDQF